MSNDGQSLSILLRAWVTVVAVVAGCGWVCSALGVAGLMGPIALVILLVLGLWWWRPLGRAMVAEVGALLRWWPLAVIALLMAVLAVVYLPSVHDTLTYRLPRVRLWMQDGGLEWYATVDQRINSLGRNWEWLAMAILQVTGSERLLVLPSLVSWALLCRVFFVWSEKFMGNGQAWRATALVLATSPLFLVQGFTTMNDLMAATLVAVSVAFLIRAWESEEPRESGIDMVFSGLALAVSSGVKPNLGVLALIWCVGAVIWLARRRGRLPWALLAAAGPLAVVSSGLPTLIMNRLHTGSVMANMESGELSVAPSSPLWGAMLGHLMFWWQSAQPVFNPLAGVLNRATAGIDERFSEIVPRFKLETEFFKFGESATVGILTATLVVTGLALALRRGRRGELKKDRILGWVACGALVGMTINFAAAIPFELARSSVAFFIPLIPLGLFGLGAFSGRWRRVPVALAAISVGLALLHMALEPNRSLLPAEVKASIVEKAGARKKVVESFRRFRERRFSGKELYEMVPKDESRVAICLGRTVPTAPAWHYLPRKTEVIMLTTRSIDKLAALPVRYVVMTGQDEDVQAILDRSDLFEVVAQRDYLSRLSEGEQPWYLLRRLGGDRPE